MGVQVSVLFARPIRQTRRRSAVRYCGDMLDRDLLARACASQIDAVFHFASVVSAGAEADFDLGMRVNVDGMRNLLEICRGQPEPPRFVFPSSVAAFGGDLPELVLDTTAPTPLSSYGTQKVIGEYGERITRKDHRRAIRAAPKS